MSGPYISDQNQIPAAFQKMGGVRFVSDGQTQYGAIFHENPDVAGGGSCSWPTWGEIKAGQTSSTCYNLKAGSSAPNMRFSSANIFSVNWKDPVSSGDGVNFYTEPFGESSGGKDRGEGYYLVKKEDIKPYWFAKTFDMTFDKDKQIANYTDNTQPDYKKTCPNFQSKPGSVYIKGRYLVTLYSGANGGWYCQTFNQTVTNLNAKEIIPVNAKVNSVYIIATQ